MIRLLLIIAFLCSPVFAGETVIKVTPAQKITTSDDSLQEGDYVKFKVLNTVNERIKEGDIVTGLVTYIEPNGFLGKEAALSIGNFHTENNINLKGEIYGKGTIHNPFMTFNDVLLGLNINIFRGGEVHFFPDKNVFLLYWEN